MSNSMIRVTAAEFCECEGVTRHLMIELVELDIAHPVAGAEVDEWVFDATGAHWMQKALRLRRELELDWVAVGMLVELMRQREQLWRDNEQLRRRLGRFLAD